MRKSKKYNFAMCMKHRCDECKRKDKCFKGEDDYVQVQNKQHRVVNRRSR